MKNMLVKADSNRTITKKILTHMRINASYQKANNEQ